MRGDGTFGGPWQTEPSHGTAAGGGYELALATDHIILADDGAAAVALPEVPLLAVLPLAGATESQDTALLLLATAV